MNWKTLEEEVLDDDETDSRPTPNRSCRQRPARSLTPLRCRHHRQRSTPK